MMSASEKLQELKEKLLPPQLRQAIVITAAFLMFSGAANAQQREMHIGPGGKITMRNTATPRQNVPTTDLAQHTVRQDVRTQARAPRQDVRAQQRHNSYSVSGFIENMRPGEVFVQTSRGMIVLRGAKLATGGSARFSLNSYVKIDFNSANNMIQVTMDESIRSNPYDTYRGKRRDAERVGTLIRGISNVGDVFRNGPVIGGIIAENSPHKFMCTAEVHSVTKDRDGYRLGPRLNGEQEYTMANTQRTPYTR